MDQRLDLYNPCFWVYLPDGLMPAIAARINWRFNAALFHAKRMNIAHMPGCPG